MLFMVMKMSRAKPISYKNTSKYIQIGLNISYYRKLRGLSQEELAEKTGISRSYLSAIEAPNIVKTLSLELLFDISDALSVEPNRLLEFKETF